jgi:hypothetical protein
MLGKVRLPLWLIPDDHQHCFCIYDNLTGIQEPPPPSSILSNVPNLTTGSAGGAGFEMLETVPQAPKSPLNFQKGELAPFLFNKFL